jgi:hypothetical protein
VTLRLPDNSTDSILVDLEYSVSRVLLEILKKRNIAEQLVDEYCLILADSSNSSTLEFDTKMNQYPITEGVRIFFLRSSHFCKSVLLLANKLHPLTIVTRDGGELVVEVAWSVRLSDILIDVCEKLHLEPNRYFLQKEGTDCKRKKKNNPTINFYSNFFISMEFS